MKYFPNTKAIFDADISILSEFKKIYQKIEHLNLREYNYARLSDVRDITRWSSLRTLVLPDCFSVTGLETLVSLTHLECDAYAFQHREQILLLTNLEHLVITDFSHHCPISSLPLLNHLESDKPSHFVGFTVEGKLDTFEFEARHFEGKEREQVQRGFDYYFKDSSYLCLKGSWVYGVFTGHAYIQLWKGTKRGEMVNGKFI